MFNPLRVDSVVVDVLAYLWSIVCLVMMYIDYVKSFPDNNRINSIQRNPKSRSVKIINGYNNMDRTEISQGELFSACKQIRANNYYGS